MNTFFYRPNSDKFDHKIIHLAESMNRIGCTSNWVNYDVPLFQLLNEVNPEVLFCHDDQHSSGHLALAKRDFPNTKLVLLSSQLSKTEEKNYDAVVYLSSTHSNEPLYLDYLINENHIDGTHKKEFETDILFITDGIDSNNQYARSSLDSIGNKFKLKMYGENNLKSIYYLGGIHRSLYKDVIASSRAVILFNDEWKNTVLAVGKIPIVYRQKMTNQFEFSNYKELEEACDRVFSTSPSKQYGKTYTDFCKMLLEGLSK